MLLKNASYLLAATPLVNAWADQACQNYPKLTNARFPHGVYDGGSSPASGSNAIDKTYYVAENGINGLTWGFPQNCGNGGAASVGAQNYFDITLIHTIGQHTDAHPSEWIADVTYGIIDLTKIKVYVPDSPQYRNFPVDERVIAFSGLNGVWTPCPRSNLERDLMAPEGNTVEAEYAIITYDCSGNRANQVKIMATYPESMWERFQFYEVNIEEALPECKASKLLTNARFPNGAYLLDGTGWAHNGINGMRVPTNCGINGVPDFSQTYAVGIHKDGAPAEWLADITAGVSKVKSLKYYGIGYLPTWYEGVKAYTTLNGIHTECDFVGIGSESRGRQGIWAAIYEFDCHDRNADGVRLLQTASPLLIGRLTFYELEIDVHPAIAPCENPGKLENARFNNPYDDRLFPAENAYSGQYIIENCMMVPDRATRQATSQMPFTIALAIGKHSDNDHGQWDASIIGGPKEIKKITFTTSTGAALTDGIEGYTSHGPLGVDGYTQCTRMRPVRNEQDPIRGTWVSHVDFNCNGASDVTGIMFRQTIAESRNTFIQLTAADFEEASGAWSPSSVPTSMTDYIDPNSPLVCMAQTRVDAKGDRMCHLFRSCFFGAGNVGPMKCANTCTALKKHFPREMCGANYRFAATKSDWWRTDEVNMQVCYKRGGASNVRFAEVCTPVDSFIDI